MSGEVRVQRWSGDHKPDEKELREIMGKEGLTPYRWSNSPGYVYSAHRHSFHKVIYVSDGSITFGMPNKGKEVKLRVGDRLDLPPGVTHNAVVGPHGVACLEAHRGA